MPQVLAMRGYKDVYQVTENTKLPPCVLSAGCAAGTVNSTYACFSKKMFSLDPMKDSVPNEYFGKSDKGWINVTLFYNWLEEHL